MFKITSPGAVRSFLLPFVMVTRSMKDGSVQSVALLLFVQALNIFCFVLFFFFACLSWPLFSCLFPYSLFPSTLHSLATIPVPTDDSNGIKPYLFFLFVGYFSFFFKLTNRKIAILFDVSLSSSYFIIIKSL